VQIYEHLPVDEQLFSSKGQLFLLASFSDSKNQGVEMIEKGRAILSDFDEQYFKSELGVFDALAKAVESANSNAQIGAVVILEDIIYAAATEGMRLQLIRGGKLLTLILGIKHT